MENIKKICHFDVLLDAFLPLTPKGKTTKNALKFINNQDELEKIYSETKKAIAFLDSNPTKADKIKWHLKRIPRLPESYDNFSLADIFIFKKFLVNAYPIAKNYALTFDLKELLELLDLDNMGEETFYLSSKYDDELITIRKEISKLDDKIKSIKDDLFIKIKAEYKLDFEGRDFILASVDSAKEVDQNLVNIEPYDGKKVVLKPVFNKDFFELLSQKAEIVKLEKKRESKVLESLSNAIRKYESQIVKLDADILSLDLNFARGLMAKKLNLTCPILGNSRNFKVVGGRFLSMEKYCRQQDLKYWKLDIETLNQNLVLYGSNMCGKTVCLQTIAFLQLTAQYGFFVPSEFYKAPLFDKIALVTDIENSQQEGLSAFGREIIALNSAVSDDKQRTLIIFDEFARTTNSTDAVILLNALLEYLVEKTQFNALISTHYDSINRYKYIDFFRMKGIKWQEIAKIKFDDVRNRINLIQQYIEYLPEKDEQKAFMGEAVKIAEILGADISLINKAKKGEMNGNN